MVFIWDTRRRELGDRLHSVYIDVTSDNHLKLLVMPCFGFLQLLYTGCLEHKCQTTEQIVKCDSKKALYILILQSLWRTFDIGANKRQSIL